MREIKFRAYNSETKKIMQWSDIKKFGNLTKLLSLNHVIVGQYTGLKDKNGIDVYFNDIIKHLNGGLGVIVWMDDRLGIASCSSNNYHAIDQIDYSEINQSEVVGNIYEHKNLLP